MAFFITGVRVRKLGEGCITNPTGCCECAPEAPADLWALLTSAPGDCACMPRCLHMTYQAEFLAYYSDLEIGQFCSAVGFHYLRLKCVDGLWQLDVVDGDDNVVVVGTTTSEPDTFHVLGEFSDDDDAVCGASFSYLLTSTDCTDYVDTDCCDGIPKMVKAVFSGALAGLGTVYLTWFSGSTWTHVFSGAACLSGGEATASLVCLVDGTFTFNCAGLDGSFSLTGTADDCDPFSLTMSGTAAGPCSGPFTVVISTV